MRSVNNVFEVAGVIYAAGLEMCMQGMNVSFLDMSHSKSNEYEGTHVILCGQDSQGGMRVIGHAAGQYVLCYVDEMPFYIGSRMNLEIEEYRPRICYTSRM
ncbi:hypothetical protein XU18_1452 [Perkinsela sp. CCAP 1560/4]|nr:hypothetical protein XU18_1452 [Perkinsela sp. CCAP 1560/4]|eukprot:KNH07973.1 hypothetical protein XU18_1452 [Perkinsela sp. CCAP 1560/4]